MDIPEKASESVLLRLTPTELEDIDRVSAPAKRGPWIKRLCRDAVAAYDGLLEDPVRAAIEEGATRPLPEEIAAAETATEVVVEAGSAYVDRHAGAMEWRARMEAASKLASEKQRRKK